jgi:hypothetical protein
MQPLQPLIDIHGSAILSGLAFLGTAAFLSAAGLSILILLSRRSWFAAKRVARVAMGMGAAYAAALTGVSLASDGRTVEPGAERYVCEIGCHFAYSVVDVRRVASIGDAKPTRGAWAIVTLQVRFDPATVPASRGDAPLTPNPRVFRLVDAGGGRFDFSMDGALELTGAKRDQALLVRELRPGESHRVTLVFDVPPRMADPVLQLTESTSLTRLLIGHERSLLHARTVFRLRGDDLSTGVEP